MSTSITFPALFDAADDSAIDNQRVFLRVRCAEYIALSLSAVFAQLPRGEASGLGPVFTFGMFLAALVLRVSGVAERAERRWYDARAAAESIKSASWQYAAGGEAYRIDDGDARTRFTDFLKDVLKSLPHLDIPAGGGDSAGVTAEMDRVRNGSLAARVEEYEKHRVADQLDWYARKARWNRSRARSWRAALITIEGAAVTVGLLRVLGTYDVDWLGVFAVIAAGVAAWQQTKNYATLSEAYSVTSHEVGILRDTVQRANDEGAWAQAVHDAEAAFSREHTMWLARRQGPMAE